MARQFRPVIGINADFVAATKTTTAQARVAAGYFDTLLTAGALPLILPPIGKDHDFDGLLDRIDGIVLSGGLDIDPRRQGQSSHPSVQPMASRRDDSDRYLIECVVERRMPVLAIGVGTQQLNLAHGGSLYHHLPEDLPRALPHRDTTGGPHRHAVMIEPNTRMEEIYGAGEIRVNSAHHQAVRQVGEGLRVAARSLDNVIEAIETTDANWFCVGVQWHPESETASALDMQLYECFLQACLRQEPLQIAA
jgi:putative glutamine amidotransferase